MKYVFKENSHKYLATVFQFAGFACCSGFGSKVLSAFITGDLTQLSIKVDSFLYCLWLFVFGAFLLSLGWYIMYRIDKAKTLQGEKQ